MADRKGRRGIIVMLLGAGGGQAVAFALSPIISRLFTVDDFGQFSVINSAAMIFGAVAALRLDAAIPLPRGLGEARTVMQVALGTAGAFALALCLVVTAIGLVAPREVSASLGFDWEFLYGVPLLGLAVSAVLTLNQFAVRRGRFGAVGRRNFLAYGVGAGAQSLAGVARGGGFGLIGGAIVGQTAALLSLLWDARGRKGHGGRLTRSRIAIVRRRYSEFPREFAPAVLLNSLGAYLPPILITATFGVAAAGTFGFAHRILAFPVGLLSTAISQYYLNRLVQARSSGGGVAKELFCKTTIGLSVCAALGVLIVLGIGPFLFATVFGEEWRASGEMARWLVVALGAQLIASPLSQTLVVYRASRLQLSWDLARLLVVLATLWGLPTILDLRLETAIVIFAVSSVFTYVISWVFCATKVWSH